MSDVSSFLRFLQNILSVLKIEQKHIDSFSHNKFDEYELASHILHELNVYFYQHHSSLDLAKEYISDFHKYWEQYHAEILKPQIDIRRCRLIADELENIYKSNKIKVMLDTLDLNKEEIAQVRFFTSIQDFKIDIYAKGNPFEIYKRFPECFDPKLIISNIEVVNRLLDYIDATDQGDKRKKWMVEAAKLLVSKYGSSAYKIAQTNNNNVIDIKNQLIEDNNKFGFSDKKANMFIRDMIDLNVWENLDNIETLDLISDANTMRIALRTGILGFSIPLLASYLDVYCYQYSLVDKMSREAWRTVWSEWKKKLDNNCPMTPASFDYFIYRMGKMACKPQQRKCHPNGVGKITEKKFSGLAQQDKLIFDKNLECIFINICNLSSHLKLLNPPKSISQLGRTGWNQGKTNEGGGGGISS